MADYLGARKGRYVLQSVCIFAPAKGLDDRWILWAVFVTGVMLTMQKMLATTHDVPELQIMKEMRWRDEVALGVPELQMMKMMRWDDATALGVPGHEKDALVLSVPGLQMTKLILKRELRACSSQSSPSMPISYHAPSQFGWTENGALEWWAWGE